MADIELENANGYSSTGTKVLGVVNGILTFLDPPSSSVGGTNFVLQAWIETNGNDSTAELGNSSKPYATLNAAQIALNAGETSLGAPKDKRLNIGLGTFNAPSQSNLRSHTIYSGSGQPVPDYVVTLTSERTQTLTTPTKLVGGTVVRGLMRFDNFHNITVENLGIDVGSAYVSSGGTADSDALVFNSAASNNSLPPYQLLRNIRVENVTTLGSTANAPAHGIIFQDCFLPTAKNVLCVGNGHGFISKSVGGHFSDVKTVWNALSSIILKSNTYAYQQQTILDGFYCRSLSLTLKESQGVRLHQESLGCGGNFTVKNGIVLDTQFGLTTVEGVLENVNIENVQAIRSIYAGFYLSGLRNSKIRNCVARDTFLYGFDLYSPTWGRLYVSDNLADNCQVGFRNTGTRTEGHSNSAVGCMQGIGGDTIQPISATTTEGSYGAEKLNGYEPIAVTSTGVTYTGGILTASTEDLGYGHTYLATKKIAGAGAFAQKIRTINTDLAGSRFGLDDTNAQQGQASFKYGAYITSGQIIGIVDNGSIANTATAAKVGDWVQLRKSITGEVTLELSADDGVSWTVLYTFPTLFPGNLYLIGELFGSFDYHQAFPQGIGLS